ncbi:lysozyme [Rodentibacter pneumotropicus]|uniref:Lysozyme n=1 Tax=Rodentibacter pneumotropicus TaxID=758 RepID=A0A4S2Q4K7_9PAST|nr:lysozyme [Rodentibacter pneumotropicus]NBH76381.1 lysozyme [Rodentibacter pneumotropicus]THA06695.1 lysozyme [Rodentibacter pneumotropicus]THA11553.1 lysozyme [Rodentibacter pneumotropicus]THA14236.1 lysozyme [Rodentibacter pneumotropicus]
MSKKLTMILCSAAAVAAVFFAQQKDLPAKQQNQVSQQAVYMIVNLEGCVRNPYKCPADVWTNGVGNTHNVDKTKILSLDEVAADLRRNIKEAENCINADFNGHKMNQGQYDSMVSLTFNLGCGNIKSYYSKKQGKRVPTTLYRAAQAENWALMCNRITDFNKAGGHVLKGLQMRRTKEKALCLGE